MIIKIFIRYSTILLSVLLVAGCGGGSGVDNDSPGGISGSGRPVTSVGSIDVNSSGSLELNGSEYDADSAEIFIDGAQGSISELEGGQVVLIEGELAEDGFDSPVNVGTINYLSNVIGPIGSINTADLSIRVLGQKVQFGSSTVYGDGSDNFSDLNNADIVRVSGFVDSEGSILSARIDVIAQVSDYQVVGTVTNVDNSNSAMNTFMINALTVRYDNTITNLQNGDIARVNGIDFDNENTVLTATTIEVINSLSVQPEQVVSLDGFITRFESIMDFDLNGIPVSINDPSLIENGEPSDLGVDARVRVVADINEQGIAIANNVFIVSTTPIRFSGSLAPNENQRYTITASENDVGLWLTLTGLTGFADLVVFDEQGREVCASIELSDINNGFCYVDNTDGQNSWDVYIYGYSDTEYELTGYFRRAEFGDVTEITPGTPTALTQYAGDRSLYRISTEGIDSNSFLAVTVDGLDVGARLAINGNGQPTSSIFSCQLIDNFLGRTCWLQTEGVDDFYINIENSAQASMTIYADFISPTVVENGEVSTEIITYRQGMLYQLEANTSDASIAANAGSPSDLIKMKVHRDAPPTGADFHCFSEPFEIESAQCITPVDGPSTWYVLVEGDVDTRYDFSALLQAETAPMQTLVVDETIDVTQAAGVIATYSVPTSNNVNEALTIVVNDLSSAHFEVYISDGIGEFEQKYDCQALKTDVSKRICRVVNNTSVDNWTVTVQSAETGSYSLSTLTQTITDINVDENVSDQIPNSSQLGLLYRLPANLLDNVLMATLSSNSNSVIFSIRNLTLPSEYVGDCNELSNGFDPVVCTFDVFSNDDWYFLVNGNPGDNFSFSVESF